MRRMIPWVIVLVVLALVGMSVIGALPRVQAQYPTRPAASISELSPNEISLASQGKLIALSVMLEGGRQQVTVIDPEDRVMSVYHIDPSTGAISLKSVRNISADLRIDDFNGGAPAPREIRALLDQR